MNKKFYGTLLLGTLLLGSTIVSCKDYDDDIDNLQNQITQLATKADMQSEVSKLQSAVATAQAAAENKAAAAEQAAKDAAAKAQAAADAAAKAQGTADAAATVEALNKVAAEAAAAAQAAADAKTAAEAKAAELEAQLAELQALAATLVSTEDFEAAKKELNDKYAELAAKIGETTGVTGMTGINLVGDNEIAAGYGVWAGVHNNMTAAEWDGPKAEEINAIEKGTKLAAWGGVKDFTFSVNPTDFDASKIEAFAVVNQFDEVAPIAFGTPKAVTRAAAGAWTLPVLGNAIYGEKAAEFAANFSKNANDQDGSVATLAAGQFAGALKAEFCKVTPNVNTSATDFKKDIAFDAIDGTAALEAEDASVVLDAYITKINSTFNGNVAHDSVVYKLAYTGTTLTYDAEAVKKFMSTAADNKKIEVEIKEINLNGYIHTKKGTITFSKKEAAKPVVLERIPLAQVPHTIVPIVWNKSAGDDVNNQKVTVSLLPALEKWGIDLSETKEAATIHWNHTDFTDGVEVIEDSVYYLSNDQTPVYLTGFATAELSGKEADKKKNAELTLKFTTDYGYTTVADEKSNLEDDVDAAFNGKIIYIPVKMTGTDTDNGVKKTVEYSVVVPVKFNKINIADYYQWNKGKAIKLPLSKRNGNGTYAVNLANLFEATATTGNATTKIITLEAPTFTVMNTNHENQEVKGGTKAYIVPSATVSGQLSVDAYTKALADMQKKGYAKPADKTKMEAELQKLYTNAVGLLYEETAGNWIHQGYLNVKQAGETADKYKWVLSDAARTTAETTKPTVKTPQVLYLHLIAPTAEMSTDVDDYVDTKYTDLLNDAKYTVNGLTATIMGRSNVALPGLEVEVYTDVAATATITTEAKLNASGETLLYNALFPAASPENFDGSFSLKDANGKTIELTAISQISYKKVKEDGSLGADVTGVAIAKELYDIDTDGTKKGGLKITITTPSASPAPATDVASGDKIAIIFTYTGVIAGTSTPSTAQVTLKVEIK